LCYEFAVRRKKETAEAGEPHQALAVGVPARGWRVAVAVLFVVALALRLLYLYQLAATPLGQVLLGDGVAYDAWARRIAAGDWWGNEVFYQAPFYPYVLALIYAVTTPDPLAARIFQALVGAATCVLAAAAGRRWFDARSGLAAGALLALYPPTIFFDGEIQKGTLTLFLATALVWLLARRAEPPRPGWCLAVGVLTGFFALDRENALLLVPLLALWLAATARGGWAKRAAPAALLVTGALAVLLPVALRNRAIGGELLLTTAQLGPNFYIGNHAGADGRYQPLVPGRGSAQYERADATALAERGAARKLTPGEVSRWWLSRSLAFVRDEPGRWLALLARKTFLVWNRLEIVDTTSLEAAADSSWLLAGLSRVLHFGVLCPLAAAGIWLTRRRWRELAVLYLMLGAWAIAIAAFFVFARYRLPMVPILALFAGAGLAGAAAEVRARRAREWLPALLPAVALAIATALVVNWPADDRDPRVPTYANLGVALDAAGRRAEGIVQLERAVALSPGFAEAHLALGHLRSEGGDRAGAGAAYARVVELDPASAPAWNGLGLLAAGRGDRDEARRCFARAVAADAGYVEARFNLARTLFEAGDLAGARRHFAALVELTPADVEARERLADLLAFDNQYAAAVGEYERVVALAPDRAFAHFKLALARDRLSGPAAAAGDLRRALALEPRYAARLLGAAAAEEAAGRPTVAERLYRLLLATRPDPEAERRLAALARRPT
jgi:4-amino-4-deoxy-L-arabinose transferase-like glycosyltransferase/predicted TPR repeat methyltransferase